MSTFAPEEIDRLRRFGTVRHYRAGEALFVTGEIRSRQSVWTVLARSQR